MGRSVNVRTSYLSDANYFVRIKTAIEKDPNRKARWKRDLITHIDTAIALMLDDEKKRISEASAA